MFLNYSMGVDGTQNLHPGTSFLSYPLSIAGTVRGLEEYSLSLL